MGSAHRSSKPVAKRKQKGCPIALAALAVGARLFFLHDRAAEFSANPFVQALQVTLARRVAEVGHPAVQKEIQLANHFRKAYAPVSSGDLLLKDARRISTVHCCHFALTS